MNSESLFWDVPLAVLDVETTGFDSKKDRVIEVAIIHMQAGEVVERYSTLINPERDVPEEVVRLTHIDPTQLLSAPRFAEVAAEVHRRLEGKVFVAYNLAFDRGFITEELGRCGLTIPSQHFIDPLIFVRELHRNDGSKRLTAVCERLGIELTAAHRAADDATATGHVLYKLLPKLPPVLGDLEMLQQQWEMQQKNETANWRNNNDRGMASSSVSTIDRGNALGPAYLYSDDSDPVRAMFVHLPDGSGKRG